MSAVAESDLSFATFLPERPFAGDPTPLAHLRSAALARFEVLGFPTVDQEAWRSTNVEAIAHAGLVALSGPAPVPRETVEAFGYPGSLRLTFVDGFFVPELSETGALPAGVVVGGLRQALEDHPELVLSGLGRHASFEHHAFVALNTAAFQDGGFVFVPRGVVLETPIHLLSISATAQAAAYPRQLILLAENSQATVVESYVGLDLPCSLTCAVTEIVLGPNAVLDHYKIQREGLGTYHLATQQTVQDRASTLRSHSISIGGALTRNDLNALLDGEGVSCTLNGLYLVDGLQLVDNHMRVDHAKPNGYSHELYKGIIDGHGRSVFNGLIHVHPGAQKTDAVQANRNLLLSREALASSNPQLEIFANDVRCTHGSTIGQLEDDAIFYLRSRGISEDAAKSLLTYAFASDILERIKVEPVRQELEEFLFHRLPQGEIVRQAV